MFLNNPTRWLFILTVLQLPHALAQRFYKIGCSLHMIIQKKLLGSIAQTMHILQQGMPIFGRFSIAAHQYHARLFIENSSFLRLVACPPAELQAVFKSLLCLAPIALYGGHFTQNAIN